jgi:hypothetical protein
MVYLNKDVLSSIFEELRDDNVILYSCLLVDRTWCETAVPILWKNPMRAKNLSKKAVYALFNVIFSYLSKELRDSLKNQEINKLFTKTYQHLSFNYINFWRYLEFNLIDNIIEREVRRPFNVYIIRSEILNLFIKNTKFTHFFIYINCGCQLHKIPGAEHCFSELKSFHCIYDNDQQSILEGLASICKSIRRLVFEITCESIDNSGIIKLIEAQKNLNDVRIYHMYIDESFYKTLEETLVKHANTLQYLKIDWKPMTRFLSYLVNLLSLEINVTKDVNWNDSYYLENISLPTLKILKTHRRVSSNFLANLIENTKGTLSEIIIDYDSIYSNRLIQTIYQDCPNLRYLELSLYNNANSLFSEFENLLINCQSLNELVIFDKSDKFHWDKFFLILTKSSPIGLFNFKFYSCRKIKLEDMILFFDNWKDRNPMLLKLCAKGYSLLWLQYATKTYMKKGIIKTFI